MGTTYFAAAHWGGTGILDWIIGTGFLLVVGGIPVFRVLAKWRSWVSDD